MTRDEREKVQKLVLGIDHSTGGRRLASGQLESALTAVRALLAPQPEEEPGHREAARRIQERHQPDQADTCKRCERAWPCGDNQDAAIVLAEAKRGSGG